MPIIVNGVSIPDAIVFAEMQHHPARTTEAAQRCAAEALVIREVLRQRARAKGLGDRDDAVDALLAQEIVLPEPDEETCRRYYENNRARFRSPDLLEVEHILIAADPEDQAEREAAREKAKLLIGRIETAPDSFAALAAEHSACPSKANGGHLGQVTRGSTVPEFETFLFSLDEGELCAEPVPSRYGFHVVRLLRRAYGRELPFESVKDRIAGYLGESVWRRAVRQYIQIALGAARIEGIDMAAASTPLVQ